MGTVEKIFKSYFESKKVSLYFSEIKDLSNLSHSSLQNSLNKLIEQKCISVNKTKSNTYYNILDKKRFALEYSKIALNNFKSLNRNIKIPLDELLGYFENQFISIVLFGSSSRKDERIGSDIDLMIISDIKYSGLLKIKKKIDSISNFPLSIFEVTRKDFINSDDNLVREAKETGFPIKGEQFFYEVILNEYNANLRR